MTKETDARIKAGARASKLRSEFKNELEDFLLCFEDVSPEDRAFILEGAATAIRIEAQRVERERREAMRKENTNL